MTARWAAAGVSALAAGLAMALGWHHPLAAGVVLAAAGLAACAAAWDPIRWPLWTLPCVPLIGLMPWTGWLVVEELDILVLCVAAGAYARWAVHPDLDPAPHAAPSTAPSLQVGWLVLMAASTCVSAWIGIEDAGGLTWGWWQGYREPLNSIRLLKPCLLALLLLPLVWRALRRAPSASAQAVQHGMVGLLVTVALCVWWERWAYTGLADFSSDYRATALFWEMHVGGAALDAALVMSLPFAVLALTRARSASSGLLAAAALVLGAYAALVTFSRIVYVAAPVAAALTVWLANRQAAVPLSGPMSGPMSGFMPRSTAAEHPATRPSLAPTGPWILLIWLAGISVLSAWLFPAGGYRSLLALLGAAVLLLPLVQQTRPLPKRAWVIGLMLSAVSVTAVAAVSAFMPKGTYLAYAAAWMFCAAALWRARHAGRPADAALVAGYAALLAALVAVGVGWGGAAAWLPGLGASGALLLAWMAVSARRRASWPESARWQAQVAVLTVVVATVVGVFGGGSYMSQRFTQSSQDGVGREVHWSRTLSWLKGLDWLAGKGLGRYAASYSLSGSSEDQVGDYRLMPGSAGRGQTLLQTAGMHPEGGWFRVAQRVGSPAPGSLKVRLDILASEPTEISVEICEKHLLYPVGCIDTMQSVARPGPQWQQMTLPLNGTAPTSGPWWAPRWIVFSMSVVTPSRRVELDNIELLDSAGRSLLVNGDFERGMARWFTTSDRNHLPWHAKNVAVHLLFEQGLLGLITWALASLAALWRLTGGAARDHSLAPALAGALAGVLIVGMVDSLLDMPRIGWLMWMLWAAALVLPASPRAPR